MMASNNSNINNSNNMSNMSNSQYNNSSYCNNNNTNYNTNYNTNNTNNNTPKPTHLLGFMSEYMQDEQKIKVEQIDQLCCYDRMKKLLIKNN